jgi:hypothetical protein
LIRVMICEFRRLHCLILGQGGAGGEPEQEQAESYAHKSINLPVCGPVHCVGRQFPTW